MPPTSRVLLGLAAGLSAGVMVSAAEDPSLLTLVFVVEPLGRLWINALQMTVVPLVVSLLVTGIASATDAGAMGRLGLQAISVFLALLLVASTFTALVAPPLLAWLTVDPAAVASLRSSVSGGVAESATALPPFAEWITGLVPTNPIRAASEGAMLPLIVFSLLFGFAAAGVASERRSLLIGFFRAVAETMLVLVRWVLWLAPAGVFVLIFALTARVGVTALGAFAYYIVLLSALLLLIMLALYPLAVVFGRVPLPEFARASAPAQAVAASTQSSLASLPAMIEGAERRLGLPVSITGFVLPFAVSTFRISSPVGGVLGAFFIARLYGIDLSPGQMTTVAMLAVATSLGGVGLPGGSSFFVVYVPVFLAVGLPVEGVAVLLALDSIPDIFRTITNVTADMAAATILARRSGGG